MKTAKAPAKILDAYRALLSETDDHSKISIQNIADRAGISRTTFYAHFDSIEELTESLVQQVAAEINEIIREGHRLYPGMEGYVEIYTQLLRYIRDLREAGKTVLLEDGNRVLTDQVSELIQEYLLGYYKERHETHDPKVLAETALFWTHGVTAMIRDWVAEGCRPEPAEMAQLMCDAIGTCADFFKKRTFN